MTVFKIEIEDSAAQAALARLADAGKGMPQAMRAITGLLERQAEDNFAAESGPLGKWPAAARATLERRVGKAAGQSGWRKDGRLGKAGATRATGIKLLQDTGRLAAAVHGTWSPVEAVLGVGADPVYAAIHQLGGNAGRGKKVHIPARPYLPFVGNQLQAGLEDEITGILQDALARAVEG